MTWVFQGNRRALLTVIVVAHVLLQVKLSGLSLQSPIPINRILDLAVVVLLALIWRSSWVKFIADPTEQKRYVWYAFTVVNIRQYHDLLPFESPTIELLADFLSLSTVYLMLKSQAKTILLSDKKQRGVQWFYVICSVLIFLLGAAEQLASQVLWRYLYVLVFTGSHLVILGLLFFWYFVASLTSSDLLVTWRFRFLVLGAVAYFSMFVFNMFATFTGGYDLPGWDVTYLSIKTGLIALGLYAIYLAFSMGPGLAETLLKISARTRSVQIWEDLILLAARLSDVVAAKPGNIVCTYAMNIAQAMGLPPQHCEVLRSAANTAYFLWNDELPDLSIPCAPMVGTKAGRGDQLTSTRTLFAEQLLHLQAVSRVLQGVDRPYSSKRLRPPIESRILLAVLDFLRLGDLEALEKEKGKKYDPEVVNILARLVSETESVTV